MLELILTIIVIVTAWFLYEVFSPNSDTARKTRSQLDGNDFYINKSGKIIDVKTGKLYEFPFKKKTREQLAYYERLRKEKEKEKENK